MDCSKTFCTDWLASDPVFYNEITGKASRNINEVIDWNNVEFDAEGLLNFLNFGYAVFEQTPIKGVKFMRHTSELQIKEKKSIITCFDDKAADAIGKETHEDDVLHLLWKRINEWADANVGEIVLPISGGLDSRLLAFLIKDKNRLRTFTYGISTNQQDSFEAVKARAVADILNLNWQLIPLGSFHKHFNHWDEIYGISSHAHGMYHMEFYENMLPMVSKNAHFLSGIIGDAWAGSLSFGDIKTIADVKKLAITHSMFADTAACSLRSDYKLLNSYLESHTQLLNDDRYKVLASMRMKIILLSYLIRIPEHYGFKPWSPFLEQDIAMAMLNLPADRRKDRIWQRDFFIKNKLNIEAMNLNFAWENTLNLQAIENVRPQPLNTKLLRELFDESYINSINKILAPKNLKQKTILKLLTIWGARGLFYRMGYRNNTFDKPASDLLKAYCAYLTIKPVENVLVKRNTFVKQTK